MPFIVSEKEGPHGILLVISDKSIIGKRFSEGKKRLDLTQDFYNGKEMNKEEVKSLLLKAQHLHLTGKESIALGVALGIINSNSILWVEGIPHAQAVSESNS